MRKTTTPPVVEPKRPALALALVGTLTAAAVVSTVYSTGTEPATVAVLPPPVAPTTTTDPPLAPLPTDLPPIGADGDAPVSAEPPPGLSPVGGIAPVAVSSSGIPSAVLSAYEEAAGRLAAERPGCGLSVALLAAIGKVESGHARGGKLDPTGRTLVAILGPVLDGGPGVAAIRDTDGGTLDGDREWDRAVGPMQFIPSTWATWGADATGDGVRDPHNVRDAATAAGRYLCAGGRDLSTPEGLRSGILSYNRSNAYLRLVLSWMATYARGATPIPASGDQLGVDRPASPGTTRPEVTAPRPSPTAPTVPPRTTTPVTTSGTTPPSTAPPGTSSTAPPGTTTPAGGALSELICAVGDVTEPVVGIIGTLLPPAVPLPGCR